MASTLSLSPKFAAVVGGIVAKFDEINIFPITFNLPSRPAIADLISSSAHRQPVETDSGKAEKKTETSADSAIDAELPFVLISGDPYIRVDELNGTFEVRRNRAPGTLVLDNDDHLGTPPAPADNIEFELAACSEDSRVFQRGSTRITTTLYSGHVRIPDGTDVLLGPCAKLLLENPSQGLERYLLVPVKRDVSAETRILPEEQRCFEASERVFVLKWPLEKLGDGSYGIVYKAYAKSSPHKEFALKVMYERQFTTRTGLMSVDAERVMAIREGRFGHQELKGNRETTPTHFSVVIKAMLEGLSKRAASLPSDQIPKAAQTLANDVLRLFSESEQATNLSRTRYDAERRVSADIRKTLSKYERQIPSHFVEVEDYTDSFKDSTAHDALTKENRTYSLSDYAIVLDYCTHTLKGLLEREWKIVAGQEIRLEEVPTGTSTGDQTKDSPPLLIGYNLIEKTSFQTRAQIVAPYLLGVASGLFTLHLAGKHHHDVKPGNVFIKADHTQSVSVLLGDFSFIAQSAEAGTTEAVLRDVINTGTMHFRSPEQRDYSEVYHAQIVTAEDGPFQLRITDPKFQRSMTSKFDRVVFGADGDGRLYAMKEIVGTPADREWRLVLDADPKLLREKFGGDFKKRETQITIYRMPTIASDIFGLGALAYDLISGGRSAERFYEMLRSVDFRQTPFTVDRVIEWYKDFVSNGQLTSESARLQEAFERFKGEGADDYCPVELVDLIIRCMAQRMPDAYSRDSRAAAEGYRIFEGIIAELRSLNSPSSNNLLLCPMESPQWPELKARLEYEMKPATDVAASPVVKKRRGFFS